MPTTLGGLIATKLAASLPAVPVTRDEPGTKSPSQGFPYITVHEDISTAPHPSEAPTERRFNEVVQVDIWQKRDPGAESYSIKATVITTLEGLNTTQVLSGSNGVVYRLKLTGSTRMFESDTRIIHLALSFTAARHF